MNNYIRIIALAIVASAASMYAFDEYSSSEPWKLTKKQSEHFEDKLRRARARFDLERGGEVSNYTLPQLEAIYRGKAKPTDKTYLYHTKKSTRYMNMDSPNFKPLIAEEMARRVQAERKTAEKVGRLQEYKRQEFQPTFSWTGGFRDWIASRVTPVQQWWYRKK